MSDRRLSPIENLVSLEELNLWLTPVEDIGPLKALTRLKVLNLKGTRVRDISPNSRFQKYLDLYG